jgi:hypothetical protein
LKKQQRNNLALRGQSLSYYPEIRIEDHYEVFEHLDSTPPGGLWKVSCFLGHLLLRTPHSLLLPLVVETLEELLVLLEEKRG